MQDGLSVNTNLPIGDRAILPRDDSDRPDRLPPEVPQNSEQRNLPVLLSQDQVEFGSIARDSSASRRLSAFRSQEQNTTGQDESGNDSRTYANRNSPLSRFALDQYNRIAQLVSGAAFEPGYIVEFFA